MTSTAGPDERLRELLAADPPGSVTALPAAAKTELADLIVAARAQQARSLQEAFAATVRFVPFPVRGIVKKVLLG